MWKKVLSWLFVAIWLIVIYSFSAKNGASSDYQSRYFVESVAKSVTKVAHNLGFISEEPSEEQYSDFAYNMNRLARKFAHGTIYFVLAVLIMIALSVNRKITFESILITVIICFIYSLSDELHQSFVDGRTGMLTDCVIDTFGATLGSSVYVLLWKIFHKNIKGND